MLLFEIFLVCLLLSNVTVAINKKGGDEIAWISKSGDMGNHLLGIQAFIIKEEGLSSCKVLTKEAHPSEKRYLMCVGSIVNPNYVLTSAYCIHEAETIRHNIKGSLAVMVGTFGSNTQVIKIEEYIMHPQNNIDPRHSDFAKFNIAVVKLSCRILDKNLVVIALPTACLRDICVENKCNIAVISKINAVSFTIYQSSAKNTNSQKYKREIKDLEFSNKVTYSNAFYKGTNGKKLDIRRDELLDNFGVESVGQNKKVFIRAVDGTNGCALTGSPVMSQKVQAGLVALACDDRQPEHDWIYTDIFSASEWILQITANKNLNKNHSNSASCSTCTYNFFFDSHDAKNKKNMMPSIEIPGAIINPPQSNNRDKYSMSSMNLAKPKYNDSEYSTAFYKDSINAMYRQRQYEKSTSSYNNKVYRKHNNNAPETRRFNVIESPSSQLLYTVTSEATKYVDDTNKLNYRDEKLIANNKHNYGKENFYVNKIDKNENNFKNPIKDKINYYNLLTVNQKLNIDDYFKNHQYDETNVPVKYLILYRMFLEDLKLENKNLQQ